MKNRLKNTVCFILLLVSASFLLSGCGESYTKADVDAEKREAYNEGYKAGYRQGSEEQQEQDHDDFLIDGMSIGDIVTMVNQKYGVTPSEAFAIVDEYEYDSSHGGFTWTEYQNAIEAVYFTVSLFPIDY